MMPRPNLPPTPGSSCEIVGKEGAYRAPTVHLPPAAFQEGGRASPSSSIPSADGSDSSYRPISPTSPVEISKKRSASHASGIITHDDFSLPPPPTRSRKIIQMKPKAKETMAHSTPTTSVSSQADITQNVTQTGERRKHNRSTNTAAGKKIARKTAHSLIERRRRCKMNDEFGVLKDMIPACKEQEMHKLAILQASIEYLRYLEQCVTDLQAHPNPPHHLKRLKALPESSRVDNDVDEEMEDDDEGETEPAITSTQCHTRPQVSLPPISEITNASTTSPSLFFIGPTRYHSGSSASQSNYSPYLHSDQTSPMFGPNLAEVSAIQTPGRPHGDALGLGSPALGPMESTQHLARIDEGASAPCPKLRSDSPKLASREDSVDREAMAALLMLNNDRRFWPRTQEDNRLKVHSGMSVRDLLSR